MTNINNLNYDLIKYFVKVAEYKSLSKAAVALGITQAALSQSIKKLEVRLDVTLCNRNTRGIILTEQGKVLYENTKGANESFRNAIYKE